METQTSPIPHVDVMVDIEHNFRVFAGPGAGKTTWLTKHISRVARESRVLSSTKKIGVITHTKVAAKEIQNRTKQSQRKSDISTIHSFFYRNIIKPFSFLIEKNITGDDLFNVKEMNGHIEHIPHMERIRSWQSEIEKQNGKRYGYFNGKENKVKLIKQLVSLAWSITSGTPRLFFRKRYGIAIPKSNNELYLYKRKYWKKGIMHHEDVLYFTYYLIKNHPRVLEFISSKFPYIFVDEFQDTNSIQAEILSLIGNQGSIIGVIGDPAQSIYLFSGAEKKLFEEFQLDNAITDYKIDKNHRSTNKIRCLLNHIRNDIQQTGRGDTLEGDEIKCLIGTPEQAINWIEANHKQEFTTLARRNDTVKLIINKRAPVPKVNLINELFAADGDKTRPYFIYNILTGYEYYKKGEYKEALKRVTKYLRFNKDGKRIKVSELHIRKLGVELIEKLKLDTEREKNILEFYTPIQKELSDSKFKIKIGARYSKGAAKEFAEKYTLEDLLPFIKTDTKKEDKIRTIHSSKGAQFDSVLLCIDSEKDFSKHIIEGYNHIDDDSDETTRLFYVGLSRARSNLFVNIPTLNATTKACVEDCVLPISFEITS